MADRTGEQLGNYRLIRLIGRGGFAEVYLGEHVRLNTEAAIKVLHTHLESEDVENFQREARTIAKLTHPNIIRVFDFAVQDGTPFLAMDYAPNGTIRQRHAKRLPLPLETILPYVRQIADALAYAHEQKLVHRDIKPENMLVGRLNDLLLSDFGIAVTAQSSRHPGTQEMVGTVGYMAPEQIQGHPRPASDQYALGIVVYEWLCGQRPFNGGITEVATQQLVLAPPSLRARNPAISPAVEEVVMTALEKDPNHRFASTRAFAAALENAAKQSGVIFSLSTQSMPLAPPAVPPVNSPPASNPPGVRVGPPSEGAAPGAATPANLSDLPTVAGSLPASTSGWFGNTGTLPASAPLLGAPAGSALPPGAGSGPGASASPGVGSGPGGVGSGVLLNQSQSSALAQPGSGPSQASQPVTPGTPAPRPRSRRLIVALAAVLTVLLLSGGVAAFFLFSPAHPVIMVTSSYPGSVLGGPPDTVLHVRGQDFPSNAAVTFLLDGSPAPDAQPARSDGSGNLEADVTITDNWTFGSHTLTARDARGDVTQQGVAITVIPQPVLMVTSKYTADSIPAGSTSTSFNVSGKRFAPNATVTLLLDGSLAPGSQPVQSDARGHMQVTLTVTESWPLGNHQLTARDSQGNSTRASVPLTIVHQGEAGTPGPNGAPTDSASFVLSFMFQVTDTLTGMSYPVYDYLEITDGKVCQSEDDGKPHMSSGDIVNSSGNSEGITYQETVIMTCSGSYKGGKLTYTETVTSDRVELSNGVVCVGVTPYRAQVLSGTFSDSLHISGTWSSDKVTYNCSGNFNLAGNDAEQGSWNAAL